MRSGLFWILLLGLLLVLVVLIARHDADNIAGLSTDDFGSLAYYVALIVFIGSGVLVLFRERPEAPDDGKKPAPRRGRRGRRRTKRSYQNR